MKKILFIVFLLLCIVLFLNYLNFFRPVKIIIGDNNISTPNNYLIIEASEDYNQFNINCEESLWCTKRLLAFETLPHSPKGVGIEVIYKNYYANKILVLAIISRREAEHKKVYYFYKNKFFFSNKTKIINSCEIKESNKINTYHYEILKSNTKTVQLIDIYGHDLDAINDILFDICGEIGHKRLKKG